MAYRNEDEALRARVEELEEELSVANDTIARLRGEGERDVPPDDVDGFTGIPKFLHLEQELPFEVTDEGLVAISDLLNRRIPGGNVSQVGSTLTHRKGAYEMRLERTTDGRTKIRIDGDYRASRTQLAIGSPGLALLGGVFTAGLFTALRAGPFGVAIAVVLGALGGFALLRTLIQRGMAKDRKNLVATFEGVVDLARRHRKKKARQRIAPPAVAGAAAEEEALAVEEALEEEEQQA